MALRFLVDLNALRARLSEHDGELVAQGLVGLCTFFSSAWMADQSAAGIT
ncbi:MAG: hypothetical protein IPP88_18310 [Betaproteobacteria bacterium]|nr:hypothetical protein [Betaproteobacteria bacterium]